MPFYAQYVETEDVVFTGPDFVRQWTECQRERQAYAYIVPEPGEAPWWPCVTVWFSAARFTTAELRQLCQGSAAPLAAREQAGESRCGFRWPLDEVTLAGISIQGHAIVEALEGKEAVGK